MPLELFDRMPPIMQASIEAGSGPILAAERLQDEVDEPADHAGLDAHAQAVVERLDLAQVVRDVHQECRR